MPERYRYMIVVGLSFFAIGLFLKFFYNSWNMAELEDFGTKNVHIHFQNSRLDPKMLDCENTSFVEREITLTPIPAILESDQIGLAEAIYLALDELLKGPTKTELDQGFLTSINEGVKVQSVIIKRGVARVDFSGELNNGVAGSCWVMAIRSQIEKTIKQFGNIKEVILSVNGKSEGILEP